MVGKITTFETMGSADGPGIRLVLFLNGCLLRCKYCHNPETWCGGGDIKEISAEEVLNLYNKYKIYYGDKGGVTFSGGEPLLQSDFVLETAKLLKQNGIHIAIDTSGVAENYQEVLELADLVILDVKAVDEDEYKFITGKDMTLFNNFIKDCQRLHKKLWLRQVIVPGINDNEEHILKLKNFASSLQGVEIERIELLPYHSMAKSKYEKLGIKYPLDGVIDMPKDKLQELQELISLL